MVSSDGSDKQLVRAFQRGDDGAFTRLARRHQDRLFRLAILWLDDPQAAGDATQETLLRAYRGLSAFRFAAAPFTWLYRTQRRVCHELNRQRKTMPLPDVLAAPTTDTGDRIDREAAVLAVRRQVRHLPERQREVVVLRIFEDCSVRETAAAMGCREGTVKALLHKAISRLRAKHETDQDA